MLKLKNKEDKRVNERINLEEKRYNLEKMNVLPSSRIGKILILFFIVSDFIFIFQLVDGYFTQSQGLSVAAAVVIACLIDVSPSILAGFINVKEKRGIHYFVMVITSLILVGSFAVLAFIRIHSEDLIFQTMNNQITSLVSIEEIQQSAHEQGTMGMSVLFCIVPIFTSIVSFAISLFDNPEGEKKYLDKVSFIKNREELIHLETNNLELELELKRNLNSMNDKYRALELDDIQSKKIIAQEIIKLKMAQVLNKPQALTNFMEKSSEQ